MIVGNDSSTSINEIVKSDRSKILKKNRWKQSFNDTKKGSLGTIDQLSLNAIVENDRLTILKVDCWKRSLNDHRKESLKTIG